MCIISPEVLRRYSSCGRWCMWQEVSFKIEKQHLRGMYGEEEHLERKSFLDQLPSTTLRQPPHSHLSAHLAQPRTKHAGRQHLVSQLPRCKLSFSVQDMDTNGTFNSETTFLPEKHLNHRKTRLKVCHCYSLLCLDLFFTLCHVKLNYCQRLHYYEAMHYNIHLHFVGDHLHLSVYL